MAPTATVSIEPCWSLTLRRGRRGKYHQLVCGILRGVESLADDTALIVPLDGAGAMSIANLRCRQSRDKSRKIPIGTFSDEKNFTFGRNLR